VSLANADKSVADGSQLSRTTEVSEEVESDQKRSQQAFGGVDREMQPVVEAARKAVASE
jgi:hypothetical protein